MLSEKITVEFAFKLVKKEQTKNIHGNPFHVLHYRVDMPGRTLSLEPIYVGHHVIDKMDETYMRTLLVDAMPWRAAGRPDAEERVAKLEDPTVRAAVVSAFGDDGLFALEVVDYVRKEILGRP